MLTRPHELFMYYGPANKHMMTIRKYRLCVTNLAESKVRLRNRSFPQSYYYYLLTPWSIVLLEKLTGFQLAKKFPAFYGTRRFITAFTIARLLYLS